MRNDDKSGGDRPGPGGRSFGPVFWGAAILLAFGLLYLANARRFGAEELSLSELKDKIREGKVQSLTIDDSSGMITGEYRRMGQDGKKPATFTSKANLRSGGDKLEEMLDQYGVKYTHAPPSFFGEYGPILLSMLAISALFYFLFMRQMRGPGGSNILSFGKSRAVRHTHDKNRKTFDDVAGIDEAREEVREIIEFLRSPEKFQRLGGRLPKGVLLIGPPGTGKTLLAKAIAGEADVPFFSISGSDFVEMFVGVGASRVRDLFEQAKGNSPCIIFLDEIDAVGRKRSNDIPGGGIENAQTLNAILVEMDGFTSDESVIVMAATNRPDVLDPALLRPGRFDRRIYVDLPDIRGREEILKVHCKNVVTAPDVEIQIVARGTPTFSGADLENLVNEAALTAVMRGKDAVDMECFEEARDKVRFGKEKRSRQMDAEDRRATAYHEAGHALLMRLLPSVTPLHKVTIIPRGRALGSTMQLPRKDEYNMARRRILAEVQVRLGGRIAEELFLDDVTNGAAQDFDQATSLVRAMVTEWGMSEKLGPVHYAESGDGGGIFEPRAFSEATAEKIDDEVRRIIEECYTGARKLLDEHRAEVELLVEGLLEFEALGSDEVELLIAARSLEPLRDKRKANGKKAEAASAEAREAIPADAECATATEATDAAEGAEGDDD